MPLFAGVTIGAWSIVGVGAAVMKDLPGNVVAYGVPARVQRELRSAAPKNET